MISRRTLLGTGTAVLGAAATAPVARAVGRGQVPWDRLRQHLHGDLVLPTDPRYGQAKQLDLMQFDDIAPGAVAYCADPKDAALCLAFAQDNRLSLAVRSGGHSAAGYSTTTGLVVDVSRLSSVAVGDRTVSLGPGAQNVDVLNALATRNLAVIGGACPTVAAGGFVQGGGLGFLTRPLGMACDAMVSARVVLADGRTVTASRREHPDLYWALRGGGGGNFGVVTSYSLTPSTVSQVATAQLDYDDEHALDMLDGYARWLADCPREIGGAAVVTLPDAAPGSRPVPAVTLVSVGTPAKLTAEAERLRAMTGPPVSQTFTTVSYRDLMMGIYGCADKSTAQCHRAGAHPQGQLARTAFALERSRLFVDAMPREGWARVLELFATERVAGQTHQLQVLPLDGAAGDLARTETAFVHRDSRFSVNFQSVVREGPVTARLKDAARRWVDHGFTAVDPHSAGETYQNFVDPALPDWRQAYYAENYPRLVMVKKRYDPHRIFAFDQGIG